MPRKFKFNNSLDRDYNNSVKNIKSITFDISRHGKYTKTLVFENEKDEKEAIKEVERYLSKSFDEEYFNTISDDLFGNYTYAKCKETNFFRRGDLIGSSIFIESLDFTDGNVYINCGS